MALLDEVLPSGVNGTKNKINANFSPYVNKAVRFSFRCQRSSVVEQRFRKPQVNGSNPFAGSTF